MDGRSIRVAEAVAGVGKTTRAEFLGGEEAGWVNGGLFGRLWDFQIEPGGEQHETLQVQLLRDGKRETTTGTVAHQPNG
jgi:hypothetical protein